MNPVKIVVLSVIGGLTFIGGYLIFAAMWRTPVSEEPSIQLDMVPYGSAGTTTEDETTPAGDPGTPTETTGPTRYLMPANGGVWPWPRDERPEPKATLPVYLSHLVDKSNSVHGAAVNPRAGKAIVVLWETNFKEKTRATHLIWADLHSGNISRRWRIDESFYAAFDLHEDGQHFLIRNNATGNKDRDVLELCTIDALGALQRIPWKPSQGSPGSVVRSGDDHVRWAGFVGRDHIVTVCASGALNVWTLDGLRLTGSFAGVSGFPAVTPDGNRLAFTTGNHVALLDPVSGRVLSERNLGSLPEEPILAFHSEGTMLACGGPGRAVILDLKDGQVSTANISELAVKYTGLLPDFGWVGAEYLYLNGKLYDLNMPVPVWNYVGPRWASPRGKDFWTVTQPYGEKEMVLRSYRLPHSTVSNRLAQVLQQPGMFALRPGDPVRIDVSALPADQRSEIESVLQQRIRQCGYRLSASAPVVFQASVDKTPVEKKVSYNFGKSPVVCAYQQTRAHLKIVQGSRVLWEVSASKQPPFLLSLPSGANVQEYVRERYGAPDYKIFTDGKIPGVIRANKNNKSVYGMSDLGALGVRDHRY